MLAAQLRVAIEGARTHAILNESLVPLIWRGHAEGHLDDDAAQALAEAAQARRDGLRVLAAGNGPPASGAQALPPPHERLSRFPRRPAQRSPDRARSIERRRRLAASGPMPPHLAAYFTTGQAAVLAIVAAEAGANGSCERSIDELAARAGVCRSIAKRALREAVRRGLAAVEVRPREGRRHDTNRVRIVCASWRAWLLRGGGKNRTATGNLQIEDGDSGERDRNGQGANRAPRHQPPAPARHRWPAKVKPSRPG